MRRWVAPAAVVVLGAHLVTLAGCKLLRRAPPAADAGAPSPSDSPAPSLQPADAAPSGEPSEAAAPLPPYRSSKLGFQVRFPDGKAPEVEEKVLGGGAVTAHLFKVQFGSSAYVVSVDVLSPRTQPRTADELLAAARDGLLESTGGTLESDKTVTLDESPGIELTIAATTSGLKMRQRARIHVVGARVYQLLVVAPIWSGGARLEQEFLDSFAFVPIEAGDGGP